MRGAELSISAAGAGRKVGTQPFCFSRHGDAQRGSVAITHTHTRTHMHTLILLSHSMQEFYIRTFFGCFLFGKLQSAFFHTQ